MASTVYETEISDGDGAPSKKCVSILLWNFSYVEIYSVCLSVLKLALTEYNLVLSTELMM